MKTYLFLGCLFVFIGIQLANASNPPECQLYPKLQNQVADKITARNLAQATQLELMIPACLMDSSWKIESFRIVRYPKKGDAWTSENVGAAFSPESLKVLGMTKRDDVVFFEDIVVVNKSGDHDTLAAIIEVY